MGRNSPLHCHSQAARPAAAPLKPYLSRHSGHSVSMCMCTFHAPKTACVRRGIVFSSSLFGLALSFFFAFFGFADVARSFLISSFSTAYLDWHCFASLPNGKPVILLVPPGRSKTVYLNCAVNSPSRSRS